MNNINQATQRVVKKHLNAFILELGIDTILTDYHKHAVFITPDKIYRGKEEIRCFFEKFINTLPSDAINRFKLHSNQTSGDLAHIIWSVDDQVPLGTDTFVVRENKIVQQTFAMYAQAQKN